MSEYDDPSLPTDGEDSFFAGWHPDSGEPDPALLTDEQRRAVKEAFDADPDYAPTRRTLRVIAEAAKPHWSLTASIGELRTSDGNLHRSEVAHMVAANPHAVLELLDENERLRTENERLRENARLEENERLTTPRVNTRYAEALDRPFEY